IAARLAATDPTPEQKDEHENYKKMKALGDAGPKKQALETAREQDDVYQVSLALQPLLKEPDYGTKMVGVQAMQKWGTDANVKELVALLDEGNEGGIMDFRMAIGKALAAIGDKDGVPAVARRMTGSYDIGRGALDVLISFGPVAEDEVIKYLTSAPET